MMPNAVAPSPPLSQPPEAVRPLTVQQYLHLVDAGTFDDDEKLELLDGWLVPKMTQGSLHSQIMVRLLFLLHARLPDGFHVRPQTAVQTADSMPEPDLAVIHGANDDFGDRLPTAAEAPLVIDVSDTSLRRDRGTKSRIYARAGVGDYWIVDVTARVVERRGQPDAATEDWRDKTTLARGDTLSWIPPGAAEPVVIGVDEIFA